MLLTYRYKLRPTKAQYTALDRLCESQRQIYNAALQERVEAWKKSHISITKLDQFKSLTEIRSFDDLYAAVPVVLSRWSIARVDDAFKGFFSRVKRGDKPGFPRFKSKSRWRSFGFAEWSGIRLKGEKLLFGGLVGGLKLNLHRPLPDDASIKACTFTKTFRHWHVTIQIDAPVEMVHTSPESVIGIDVGVEHLATTSEGQHIENPKAQTKREKQLRVAQRALARCKRGSERRKKVRAKLALIQRKVANARSTYLHQVSADITKRYALIAVEKLKVKNMTASAKGMVDEPGVNVRQKAGLNRSMLDASFSRLIQFILYKAERAGGQVMKVNPAYTSQDCSSCGARVKKKLSQRQHVCSCGANLQRDYNAALNILERALKALGRAMPPWDGNAGQRPTRCSGNMVAEAA
jgi:putative transposase